MSNSTADHLYQLNDAIEIVPSVPYEEDKHPNVNQIGMSEVVSNESGNKNGEEQET